MRVDAAPNFERAGVISGFVLSVGSGLTPAITRGVLFAGGVMYRPSLPPALSTAPSSQQSWLFYHNGTGFYWSASPTPGDADDAFLGWVVASADSIVAVSAQQIWMATEGEVIPLGDVLPAESPATPGSPIEPPDVGVSAVTVTGAATYALSGTITFHCAAPAYYAMASIEVSVYGPLNDDGTPTSSATQRAIATVEAASGTGDVDVAWAGETKTRPAATQYYKVRYRKLSTTGGRYSNTPSDSALITITSLTGSTTIGDVRSLTVGTLKWSEDTAHKLQIPWTSTLPLDISYWGGCNAWIQTVDGPPATQVGPVGMLITREYFGAGADGTYAGLIEIDLKDVPTIPESWKLLVVGYDPAGNPNKDGSGNLVGVLSAAFMTLAPHSTPAGQTVGQEWANVVTAFNAQVNYDWKDGKWVYGFSGTWVDPIDQRLAGVDVIARPVVSPAPTPPDKNDILLGGFFAGLQKFASGFWRVGADQDWDIFAVSKTLANRNSINADNTPPKVLTPKKRVTVKVADAIASMGREFAVGREYADQVTGLAVTVQYGTAKDGVTPCYWFQCAWNNPTTDARFGGVELRWRPEPPPTTPDAEDRATPVRYDAPPATLPSTGRCDWGKGDDWTLPVSNEAARIYARSMAWGGNLNSLCLVDDNTSTPKKDATPYVLLTGETAVKAKPAAPDCTNFQFDQGYYSDSGDKFVMPWRTPIPADRSNWLGCRIYVQVGTSAFVIATGLLDSTAADGSGIISGEVVIEPNAFPTTMVAATLRCVSVNKSGVDNSVISAPSVTHYFGPPGWLSGTVSIGGLSNTDVTRISGKKFDNALAGKTFAIADGVGRIVLSVQDADHLTLTSSFGASYARSQWWVGSGGPASTAGKEYCELIASPTASVVPLTIGIGATEFVVQGTIVPPNDARYGGCKVVRATSTPYVEWAWIPKGTTTFKTTFQPTFGVSTYNVAFVSVDVEGRENSYVAGVTPVVSITTPAQDATLDLGKALAASIAAHMRVTSGVLGVAPLGITNDLVADLAMQTRNMVDQATTNSKVADFAVNYMKVAAATIQNAHLDRASAYKIAIQNADVVSLAAAKVDAGWLSVGVQYAGTVNASQVNAGAVSGCSLTLNLNGYTTTIANALESGFGYAGMKISRNSDGLATAITGGRIDLFANSASNSRLIMTAEGGAGAISVKDSYAIEKVWLDGANGRVAAAYQFDFMGYTGAFKTGNGGTLLFDSNGVFRIQTLRVTNTVLTGSPAAAATHKFPVYDGNGNFLNYIYLYP